MKNVWTGQIRLVITRLITEGHSNPAIAEIVRREFPGSNMTAKAVSSYRWHMRKEGLEALTSWQAKKLNVPMPILAVTPKLMPVPKPAAFLAKVQSWLGMFA